jgi:hypothetical protein
MTDHVRFSEGEDPADAREQPVLPEASGDQPPRWALYLTYAILFVAFLVALIAAGVYV